MDIRELGGQERIRTDAGPALQLVQAAREEALGIQLLCDSHRDEKCGKDEPIGSTMAGFAYTG